MRAPHSGDRPPPKARTDSRGAWPPPDQLKGRSHAFALSSQPRHRRRLFGFVRRPRRHDLAATGGNFILGQSNAAGTPTQLPPERPTRPGAEGDQHGVEWRGAIQGTSAHGQGVYGHSDSNAGVVGDSDTFDGVFGISNDTDSAGVSGHGDGGGYGVFASIREPDDRGRGEREGVEHLHGPRQHLDHPRSVRAPDAGQRGRGCRPPRRLPQVTG